MGTPVFALPAFEALVNDPDSRFDVCLVLSKPDALAGRGLKPKASVISLAARTAGIELWQPASIGGTNQQILLSRINELEIDFTVVTAYGLLLTEELIAAPRFGTVNIHASLLPRWRGAAPIERAILAGDLQTGISIQRVRRKPDSGPVYASASTTIDNKPASELAFELAVIGSQLLVDCLPQIAQAKLIPVEQDENLVTYADKLAANDLYLDPLMTVADNLRRVQAANNYTPARAIIADHGVKVQKALVANLSDQLILQKSHLSIPSLSTSQVLFINHRLFLQAVDGWFEVLELIPDGKRKMSGSAFADGLPELREINLPNLICWSRWG
ncbi:MAG: methionyl-tRNA formyltransferase [Coriobacteriales bacterium]|jgi:methionyl-tRNA formyltransferase|nr:methionyl-tRNA formyltransferase [Coriobacteriales bacterium]